jgi:hypothetical protein
MILDKPMIVNYGHNNRFIVLATINMIVNYDLKTFIVQATEAFTIKFLYIYQLARVFVTVSHFHPFLIFEGKERLPLKWSPERASTRVGSGHSCKY